MLTEKRERDEKRKFFSTEEGAGGNNALAAGLAGVKVKTVKPAKKRATKKVAIPAEEKKATADSNDLSFLKVNVQPTGPSVDEVKKRAEEVKETVFTSASQYYARHLRLTELDVLTADQLMLGGVDTERNLLEKANKTLLNGLKNSGQGLIDRFAVNVLITRINATNPKTDKEVIEILNLLVNGGCVVRTVLAEESLLVIGQRARVPSAEEKEQYKREGKPPKYSLFFYSDAGQSYQLLQIPSQMEGREGQVSGPDRVIFAACREMIKRYLVYKDKRNERTADHEAGKIADILKQTANYPVHYIYRGVEGLYNLYVAGRKDGAGKQIGQDGAGRVKVYDLNKNGEGEPFMVVEAVGGAGSMKSLATHKGTWIPLWLVRDYYRKHKQLPPTFEEKFKGHKEFALAFCRHIAAAVGYAAATSKQ